LLLGFFKHFAYSYDTQKHAILISGDSSWGRKLEVLSSLTESDEYLESFVYNIPLYAYMIVDPFDFTYNPGR